MYKHKRDWRKEPVKAIADRITRFFTKGQYSHCEIAIEHIEFGNGHHYEHATVYDCYSSSVQDGGVRCKQICDLVQTLCISNNKNRTSSLKQSAVIFTCVFKTSKYYHINPTLAPPPE
ncbi:conserved hypothetical protein [Haemophilus influenzae HK1212]|uniref:Uncharacterized protein n=1 Tax=Haemophilus influenzae HK1212 TaxID=456482 RepID=A0A7G2K189_HAEIF|nr:conserved hypothetical protein [Haemophilus influenzae HK1212]